MQIRPLWQLNQPDLANRLVHLTGRIGTENDDVDPEILDMSARERLETILLEWRIRASAPFWSLGQRCVCFSEATPAGIDRLIVGPRQRYEPWGLGFSKQFIFDRGGGPALYVRGDHWTAFRDAHLAPRISALATLYWPGAEPTEPGEVLPYPLESEAQWAHEREWRVPIAPPAEALTFELTDLALVIAGSEQWLAELPENLGVNAAALAHVERIYRPEPGAPPNARLADDAWRVALGLDPWEEL